MGESRFAGVDWASEEHAVCVVDEQGRIVEGRRYRHSEIGLRALCSRLQRLAVKLVAIERPDGLLIERLLDAGLVVIAVHPNQVRAAGPRYTVAGGKSDGFDSFVLAELARTDSHRFRILVPDTDQTKALRVLTRSRQDLVRTRIVLANQQRLAAFLSKHGYPGRKPAKELLGKLRAGAEGRAGEFETQARREIVLAMVSALEPIVQRISELTIEIRLALNAHPDGPTFRSLFICDEAWLTAATMLAEIGDCRDRYPSYRALAADAGQSPVAHESGKSKRATFRWACDHRLREAFNTLSDSSRHHNPWADDIYTRARKRGASHAHAARILGRSWTQIIWRLWQDHDTYNPTKHTARQRLLTPEG